MDLYISDPALKVSRSLNCFTTSICYGVENYFPRLWDTSISDAIFLLILIVLSLPSLMPLPQKALACAYCVTEGMFYFQTQWVFIAWRIQVIQTGQ